MSSSSDGRSDRPALSARSRTSSSKKLFTLRRTSHEPIEQQNGNEIPLRVREPIKDTFFESVERTHNRHRVAKPKNFLTGNGRGTSTETQRDPTVKTPTKSNGSPSSSKGKARAIGRSPLSVELVANTDGSNERANGSPRDFNSNTERIQKHPIIANTSQAQFVNLALNLSESRRRHFSSNRISSLDPGSVRVPSRSIASPTTLAPNSPGSRQSRNTSYSAAKTSQESTGNRNSSYSPMSSTVSPADTSFDIDSPLRAFGLTTIESGDFYPSETTLMRVRRAQEQIELSYQYRRLLQHLPRLPSTHSQRPQSSWRPGKDEPEPSVLGREYNPLQYIRNRKIRRRENKPLNAEGQGWKQVSAVELWVNEVSDERNKHVPTVDERFSLPSFPPRAGMLDLPSRVPELVPSDSDPTASAGVSLAKEIRPRVDWIVEPWNLLADSYWLEQDTHKSLIEDSKGRKLFRAALAAPIDLRRESLRPSHRRSASLPRSITKRGSVALEHHSRHGSVEISRGRTSQLRNQSVASNRDHSDSREGKGPWKRLIGSHSPSSTDDSSSGRRRPDIEARQKTIKERQDSMILEKQLMELMARQSIPTARHSDRHAADSSVEEFPGLSSRPSSPERDQHHQLSALKTHHDLLKVLGNAENGKEMQPRRFSAAADQRSSRRPNISINVSPPRSRSRSKHPLNDASDRRITSSLSEGEEATRLSPKSANRGRKSIDEGQDLGRKGSIHFDSRFRGLIKGTKISDLVTNPVAKVGDLFWRRDHPEHDLLNSPTTSNYDASDPEDAITRQTATTTDEDRVLQTAQYRPANLPIFTSPFRGRQRGKSFETSSPTAVNDAATESNTEQFGQLLSPNRYPRSADVSPAPSIRSPEKAQSSAESTLNHPGVGRKTTQRRDAITAMGEQVDSAMPFDLHQQPHWPEKDSLHYLNITQRLLSPLHRTITSKDAHALRALTQCMLVMSNGILKQNQGSANSSSKLLASRSVHASTHHKVHTTRDVIKDITNRSTNIKSAISTLSNTTIPDTYSALRTVETYISNKLTPTVRIASDQADKLSNELSTTRTLEIKRLNDELDLISRRQRRKFRWLRRGTYLALEWTLVGLMWWVWLLVVCFRIVRGTFRAIIAIIRWLFWL